MTPDEARRYEKLLGQAVPLALAMFTLQYAKEGHSPAAAKRLAGQQVEKMLADLAAGLGAQLGPLPDKGGTE